MPKNENHSFVKHHSLDIEPIPAKVLFINEPEITGNFCGGGYSDLTTMNRNDSIKVYVPLELSKDAIVAYLKSIIRCFGEANESNEIMYSCAVDEVITRLEVYDQVWFAREPSGLIENRLPKHSSRAIELVREILVELTALSENSTAEGFPYETIDMLSNEYGIHLDT